MKALITGILGQQGSYLEELLVEKGYDVYGVVREEEWENDTSGKSNIYCSEMTDYARIYGIIEKAKPDEIYNLAAINSIQFSFQNPATTMDVNYGGLARIMESVRDLKLDSKIYHASSSEIFGDPVESPQTETTKHNPRSPYGVSKCAGLQLAKVYREKYGMKIYCGILYNNDSPRRPEEFLSKKVCKYVASVINGNKEKLKLGNLDDKRDFGYAKEYCEWTWRIMQHDRPQDFIMATGVTHTVSEFVEKSFEYAGFPNWKDYVEIDESLLRAAETGVLVGNAEKSKSLLGFSPKVKFNELVALMTQHEIDQVKHD